MALKHRKQRLNCNQLPLFTPDSDWVAPEVWPDLSQAEYIGFDAETYDPHLHEQGPGFIRGDARVCGFSFATEIGHKFYLPIGHAEGNVDREKFINYTRAQLGRPHQIKVGANTAYDLECAWSLGIEVKGEVHDIQVAEPILDADRKDGYSLDVLAKQYLGKGKNKRLLKEAEAAFSVEHMKGMHLLPAKFVGPYAEDDADDALQVFLLQLEELKADDVYEIYQLEAKLMPILFKMRLHGVKIDLDKAQRVAIEVKKEEEELNKQLRAMAGRPFEMTGPSLEPILKARGLTMLRTPQGAPSLTNDWLLAQKDEFCKLAVKLRKTTKMRADFIEGSILKHNVRGRLHTKWQQLRGYDDEEEKSVGVSPGRIASSKPNLTQIPARDPRWGPLIRSFFIADEGGEWCKLDYAQQEPRILLHFACKTKINGQELMGAAEARQKYIDDPDIDYHTLVCNLIEQRSGKNIGRKSAKGINLGVSYGMGEEKMAKQLGLPVEVVRDILKVYHEGVPYVKQLSKACASRANELGYIRTILGRKQRFPDWEPADFDRKWGSTPVRSREEALRLWGPNIARSKTHVAINPLVQGSAADMIKQAIAMLDAEGLTPSIQVYDEINAEPDLGPSWGQLVAYHWTESHGYVPT